MLRSRAPQIVKEEDLKIDMETQKKFTETQENKELNKILEDQRESREKNYKELKKKILQKDLNSHTTVAVFDICYENILPELEKQEGSKLRNTQKKLGLLKDMLGLIKLASILRLKNQSMFPPEFTFQELLPQRKDSMTRKNKFTDYKKFQYGFEDEGEYSILKPYEYETLTSASCIISTGSAYKLSMLLPNFLHDMKWKCYYSKTIDGASYNS